MEEDKIKKEVYEYYSKSFCCKWDRHVRMQEVFPDINENDNILDYGCGLGCISHFLKKKYNCLVDAVDHSEEELDKAKIAWKEDDINFQTVSEFTYPESNYDLVFSSQVIEHVHNVGNYLFKINKMLKPNGFLVIGLPNIMNPHFFWGTFFTSTERLIRHSIESLNNYNKVHDHINAWDPYTFVTLLASCGFKLEQYLPTEGMPQPSFIWRKIPLIGKYLPDYVNKMNKGFHGNLSYTMFFRLKKIKTINIANED